MHLPRPTTQSDAYLISRGRETPPPHPLPKRLTPPRTVSKSHRKKTGPHMCGQSIPSRVAPAYGLPAHAAIGFFAPAWLRGVSGPGCPAGRQSSAGLRTALAGARPLLRLSLRAAMPGPGQPGPRFPPSHPLAGSRVPPHSPKDVPLRCVRSTERSPLRANVTAFSDRGACSVGNLAAEEEDAILAAGILPACPGSHPCSPELDDAPRGRPSGVCRFHPPAPPAGDPCRRSLGDEFPPPDPLPSFPSKMTY